MSRRPRRFVFRDFSDIETPLSQLDRISEAAESGDVGRELGALSARAWKCRERPAPPSAASVRFVYPDEPPRRRRP